MPTLGSTRVFGQQGVVTIGLRHRPLRDLYHWLVAGSWARVIVLFALVYFGTQALFGLLRVLVVARLPAGAALVPSLLGAIHAAPGDPAPLTVRAFASAVVGAVQGFVQWAELVIGAGVVLAKFSLVRARVLFSNVAVVAPHDGGTALMFRMANERTGHIVDAKVSVLLVRTEVLDGEPVRKAYDLELSRRGTALFSHAWTAIHPITRSSPLSGESSESLERAGGEVIVSLSGFDEALVKTVHARHVYPASRVRWNARFRQIVKVLPDGRHAVDYRKFHKTTAAPAVSEAPAPGTPGTPADRSARRAR